jgi:hypothetical protein
MHARARAPAPALFDRRPTTMLSCLRVQHSFRNDCDTRRIHLPYKRKHNNNNNNSNNNRERINNIIIFDSRTRDTERCRPHRVL